MPAAKHYEALLLAKATGVSVTTCRAWWYGKIRSAGRCNTLLSQAAKLLGLTPVATDLTRKFDLRMAQEMAENAAEMSTK